MGSNTVYIDESGNDGDNLLNISQPFFVICALCIQDKYGEDIKNALVHLRKKYRIQDSQKELKGSSILGTKNQNLIIEILDFLLEKESFLFFYVLEKKFMAIGRAIEDLFDPVYNTRTDNTWTHPSQLKIDIANYFYSTLSEETIKHCAVAFQKGGLNDIKESYQSIWRDINNKPFKINLQELLVGVRENLQELSEDKIKAEINFKKKLKSKSGVLHSPNLTTYFGLLSKLEEYYNFRKEDAVLAFDSANQFDSAFLEFFKTMEKARRKK